MPLQIFLVRFTLVGLAATVVVAVIVAFALTRALEQDALDREAQALAAELLHFTPRLRPTDFAVPLTPERYAEIDADFRRGLYHSGFAVVYLAVFGTAFGASRELIRRESETRLRRSELSALFEISAALRIAQNVSDETFTFRAARGGRNVDRHAGCYPERHLLRAAYCAARRRLCQPGPFAVLMRYRAITQPISFLLLAGAFYVVYRPGAEADCAAGACSPKSLHRSRQIVWISAALLVLIVILGSLPARLAM